MTFRGNRFACLSRPVSVVLLCVLCLLCACSAPENAAPDTDLPPTAPTAQQSASDVALAGITTWFSWQPAVDRGPSDAATRATPYLTDSLARALADRPPLPFTDWSAWSTADATTDVQPNPEPLPGDTDFRANRSFLVTVVLVSGTQRVDAYDAVVDVTLHRGSDQTWRIAQVTPR